MSEWFSEKAASESSKIAPDAPQETNPTPKPIKRNKPLTFELRNIDYQHKSLDALGMRIPEHRDRSFRLNVTGDSGAT